MLAKIISVLSFEVSILHVNFLQFHKIESEKEVSQEFEKWNDSAPIELYLPKFHHYYF